MKPETETLLQKLTVRERLFVEAYFALEYNGAAAVMKAGYNTKYANRMASEMLKKEKIKAAVNALAAELAEDIKLKPEWVIKTIMRTIGKAEKDDNHQAVLRGAELLAKHLGMFIERTEISGKDGEAIKYEEVHTEATDFVDQIRRLAKPAEVKEVSNG